MMENVKLLIKKSPGGTFSCFSILSIDDPPGKMPIKELMSKLTFMEAVAFATGVQKAFWDEIPDLSVSIPIVIEYPKKNIISEDLKYYNLGRDQIGILKNIKNFWSMSIAKNKTQWVLTVSDENRGSPKMRVPIKKNLLNSFRAALFTAIGIINNTSNIHKKNFYGITMFAASGMFTHDHWHYVNKGESVAKTAFMSPCEEGIYSSGGLKVENTSQT